MNFFLLNENIFIKTLIVFLMLCVVKVHLADESIITDSPEESDSTGSSSDSIDSDHPIIKGLEEIHQRLNNVTDIKSNKNNGWKLSKELTAKNWANITAHIHKNVTESETTEKEIETTEESESVTEENEKAVPTEGTKEKSPENAFIVRDDLGNICILAKFHAVFFISELTSSKFYIPKNASSTGKCEGKEHFLKIFWGKFQFIMDFSKVSTDEEKLWFVSSIELKHNHNNTLQDVENNGKKLSVGAKDLRLFQTTLGKSYYCPATELIHLNGKLEASKIEGTVEFKEIQLQPFDVNDGEFSISQRCNQVVFGGPEEPFRDETTPLAVGLTLALLTLFAVLGFSIRRAIIMRKVEYNGME